jgi:hypothetical protein
MKTKLLLKIGFGLPLLIFADYLLMAFLGCAACLFGIGDAWYCGPYCFLGKGLLLLTAILFVLYIYPDVRNVFRERAAGRTLQQ